MINCAAARNIESRHWRTRLADPQDKRHQTLTMSEGGKRLVAIVSPVRRRAWRGNDPDLCTAAGGGDGGDEDFTDRTNARGGAARVIPRCRYRDAPNKTILPKRAL